MNEELKEENLDSSAEEGVSEVEVELAKSSSSATKERKSQLKEEFDDEGQLTIDVYQTPDEIFVESPIAGVKPDELDVSITNESVTIKGKREKERRIRDEDYFYQECFWG